MRILLPPSEGKTAPSTGPRLALGTLAFPTLTGPREQVLRALTALCRDDPDRALSVLGIGPSLGAEVQRNAALPEAPCAPAWHVYTGVLFTALDPATLTADPAPLLIASGLFGLVSATDLIPGYRLSGSVTLPGLPAPRKLWGQGLRDALTALAAEHLIVDLRSQTYASLGAPAAAVTVRVVTIRNGRRVSVSHHNKATKGLLARTLVSAAAEPDTAAELSEVLQAHGWDAQATATGIVEVLH